VKAASVFAFDYLVFASNDVHIAVQQHNIEALEVPEELFNGELDANLLDPDRVDLILLELRI